MTTNQRRLTAFDKLSTASIECWSASPCTTPYSLPRTSTARTRRASDRTGPFPRMHSGRTLQRKRKRFKREEIDHLPRSKHQCCCPLIGFAALSSSAPAWRAERLGGRGACRWWALESHRVVYIEIIKKIRGQV